MPLPSPCCGSDLQQGCKFIALLSMVLSVAGIAMSSIFLFSFLLSAKQDCPDCEDPRAMGAKFLMGLLGAVFNLLVAILLFIGAEQSNLRLCIVWIKTTIILFLLDLLIFFVSIYFSVAEIEDYVIYPSGFFYSLYELWVVFAFTDEIRLKMHQNNCTTA